MLKPKVAKEIANSLLANRKRDLQIWLPIINKMVDAYFNSSKSTMNAKREECFITLQKLIANFSNKHFSE